MNAGGMVCQGVVNKLQSAFSVPSRASAFSVYGIGKKFLVGEKHSGQCHNTRVRVGGS